jgi:hypothetical protein
MGMADDDYTTADILAQMPRGGPGFGQMGRLAIDPLRLLGFAGGAAQGFTQPAREILQQGPRILSSGGYDPGWAAFHAGMTPITGGISSAETGALGAAGGRIKQPRSTVSEPLWEPQYPGIYLPPKELINAVRPLIAPESGALSRVFGTTRAELAQIAREQGKAGGTVQAEDFLNMAKNPRGSEAMEKLYNPRNEARLQNAIEASLQEPGLRETTGWYVMDPAYRWFEKYYGKRAAPQAYDDFNMTIAPYSMGAPVESEIKRGLAARFLRETRDEPELMLTHGSLGKPSADYPGVGSLQDLGILGVPGTKFNKGQSSWMMHYLEHGDYPANTPKVNIYARSSGMPQTPIGQITNRLVPDSHNMRSAGAPEAREGGGVGEASMGEFQSYGPWWENKISAPLGLSSRETQPPAWTVFGPQTGVKTLIGAGKLELLANQIERTAARERIPIAKARELVLRGRAYTPFAGVPLGAALMYGQQPEQ